MAMLAEPRRKQRIGPNPRGLFFTEDDQNRGRNMLQKMGWKDGDGLGLTHQGISEPIKPKVQQHSKGLGFDVKADPWVEHNDKFSELLQSLNSSGDRKGDVEDDSKADRLELEKNSKSSKSRIHYQKFVKNKDLSKCSTKDWECIFGKSVGEIISKKKDEKTDIGVHDNVDEDESVKEKFLKGGSMIDYFKQKFQQRKAQMQVTNKKNNDTEVSEKETTPRHTDLGDDVNSNEGHNEFKNSTVVELSVLANGEDVEYPKKKKRNKVKAENSIIDNSENSEAVLVEEKSLLADSETLETPKKKKKSKSKATAESFVSEEANEKIDTVECTQPINFETEAEEPKKKKKKNEISQEEPCKIMENSDGDVLNTTVDDKSKKKRKKNKGEISTEDGELQKSEDIKVDESSTGITENDTSMHKMEIDQEMVDASYSNRKSKKKRKNKVENDDNDVAGKEETIQLKPSASSPDHLIEEIQNDNDGKSRKKRNKNKSTNSNKNSEEELDRKEEGITYEETSCDSSEKPSKKKRKHKTDANNANNCIEYQEQSETPSETTKTNEAESLDEPKHEKFISRGSMYDYFTQKMKEKERNAKAEKERNESEKRQNKKIIFEDNAPASTKESIDEVGVKAECDSDISLKKKKKRTHENKESDCNDGEKSSKKKKLRKFEETHSESSNPDGEEKGQISSKSSMPDYIQFKKEEKDENAVVMEAMNAENIHEEPIKKKKKKKSKVESDEQGSENAVSEMQDEQKIISTEIEDPEKIEDVSGNAEEIVNKAFRFGKKVWDEETVKTIAYKYRGSNVLNLPGYPLPKSSVDDQESI